MKKAFRKSLKRQASLGTYFKNYHNARNEIVIPPLQNVRSMPILWQALALKYQFNYPRDWYRIESHWLDQIESFQEQPIDCPGRDGEMNNAITRISQCNESFQLCNSLPRSFIVPKDLKDVTLVDTMSTVIKDHRVPVISYCCPIEYRRNFILRSASSDQMDRVIETLGTVVKPLEVFDLTTMAPSVEVIESAHRKLRDACRPKEEDQTANFIAKRGKWLSVVSKALKIVKATANTLLNHASVILIEHDDRGWNSLVSSLVQLLLEPHRRTVEGFESLISKEWIYLSGGQTDHRKPDILFILFLDCTYQIFLQNIAEFEFSSEYLRYLFDAQYMYPSQSFDQYEVSNSSNVGTINNNNNNDIHNLNRLNNSVQRKSNGIMTKSKTASYAHDDEDDIVDSETASYKPSSINMVSLNIEENDITSESGNNEDAQLLERSYNLFMFNPYFEANKDRPIMEICDHIANIKLWTSLYLRWMQPIRYSSIYETLYFQLSCVEDGDRAILQSPS